jgi:hypothetical protein
MVNLFSYNYKILEDFENLYDFFYCNQNKFKKHINGERKTNKHLQNIKILKDFYEITFPYGYCFPISQFIFYYLGGYNNKDISLMCIKKIPININNYNFFTSHWFVYDKKNNLIIDLTKKQFDKIIDINKFYNKARRANYGFPYFKKNNKRYINTVPSSQVMNIYQVYREKKINIFLEEYYKEYTNNK